MGGLETLDGEYDNLIVGVGTAGCVLAIRLAQDSGNRILLLEARRSDRSWWVRIPAGCLYRIGNPRTDWPMETGSEPGLNGRRPMYQRGKVIGGCSSVNGVICMRGQAADRIRLGVGTRSSSS